jgi:hypothetical protein
MKCNMNGDSLSIAGSRKEEDTLSLFKVTILVTWHQLQRLLTSNEMS